jgi:hypothetical protein
VHHVCSFHTLTWAAVSVGELEHLAGVVNRDALWRAAQRAFKNPSLQCRKLMDCIRGRIAQRYHRGELLDAERQAMAVWCGERASLLVGKGGAR